MKKTFLWFLILLFSSIAHGEKVALTIGNDLYINVPKLQKARNDAVLIGTNLEKIGYKVTVLKDTTRSFSIEIRFYMHQVFRIAYSIISRNKKNYFIVKIKEE